MTNDEGNCYLEHRNTPTCEMSSHVGVSFLMPGKILYNTIGE